MNRQAYPTNLNDTQWALIAPLLPRKQSTRGRPRIWSERDILDGILYIARGGCGWRLMPHDLPPWQTVYGYYWQWRNTGLWEKINTVLVQKVRVCQGRKPQPSAGIIDSQSVKTSEGGEERGVDVYKQVSGRKRHIIVDTLGLLLLVLVHRASIPDGNGGKLLGSNSTAVGKWKLCVVHKKQKVFRSCHGAGLSNALLAGWFAIDV